MPRADPDSAPQRARQSDHRSDPYATGRVLPDPGSRHRPPSTAVAALGITYGHQVPAVQVHVFADLDARLRARGWVFHRHCSGPEVLTWCLPSSDLGSDYLDRGVEPITRIVVSLDRSTPADHVADCAVEIRFAGAPQGQGRHTDLAGLRQHLDSIERPIPPPRAGVVERK